MLSLPSTLRIFLAVEAADMRKGFDGLSQLVRDRIAQNPLSGHLYVFRNKRRDRVKILTTTRLKTSSLFHVRLKILCHIVGLRPY